MKKIKNLVALLLVGLFAYSSLFAINQDSLSKANLISGARIINDWNRMIIEITMLDGFSPAVSKRNCNYPNIAAYEAARFGYPNQYKSLAGQLTDLKETPKPNPNQIYDWRVCAIQAYRTVVNKLLYRAFNADSMYKSQLAEIAQEGIPQDIIEHSKEFGETVGKHIIVWMVADGHTKIQGRPRFNFPRGEDKWEPTPPDFPDPLDPYFRYMRCMVMDSATQFRPLGPLPFSKEKGSPFYEQNMQVYILSKSLTKEQELIGRYWDDSPIKNFHQGHFVFNQRQISPGGHWMNITGIACKQLNKNMMETIEAYTYVAICMWDGFINCWDEKYRSNVIRPVTYINRYIDSTWKPIFDTPPFPEHTSGHSTVSACAAQILTLVLGDNVPFVDDTEVIFGFHKRNFISFLEAAQEVNVSRIYAGIHYPRACYEGNRVGKVISKYIYDKLIMGVRINKDTSNMNK